MAKAKMTVSTAICKVLADASEPLKASEIAKLVVPMVPGLKGKTPAATVAAKIYTEAKKSGGFLRKAGDSGFVLSESAKVDVAEPRKDGESPIAIAGSVVINDGVAGTKSPEHAKPRPKPQAKPKRSRVGARA